MVMTIDDEIQLQPATSGDGAIVPEGRYTFELVRLEVAPPSSFKPEDGNRIKWVFNLYAEAVSTLQRGQLFMFNGEPYEFWRTTSTKNSPRAFARQYAEALLGRKLGDQEVPKLSTCIGLRMSALISYDDDPDDSSRQILKMTGLKHAPAAVAAPSAKPAPGQVSADPTDEEIDRAVIVTKLQKAVSRLVKLDDEAGTQAQAALEASDLDDAPLADLHNLLSQVQVAIDKALDD